MHFRDVGMLEVLTPISDPSFPAFDFKKCLVNVQLALMDQSLQLEPCNVGDPVTNRGKSPFIRHSLGSPLF